MDILMSAPTKEVRLYARGRVPRHGHRGGNWSCSLLYGRYTYKSLSGDDPSHTAWRMELVGIIAGLKALKYPCIVEVKTANEYIVDCGDRLLRPKSSDPFVGRVHRGSAKNADLWQQIEEMNEVHQIRITSGTATALRGEVESARYWAAHGPFVRTSE